MQIFTMGKKAKAFFSKFNSVLLLFLFSTFATNAQLYINGPLSTGAISNSGVTAPAGTTWSEVQNNTGNTTESNTSAGYSFTTGTFTLADNFTVPAGQTWALSKISVFAYITGSPATPSPFTDLRVQIWNGNPSTPGSTVIFGDLTTNRLSTAVDALMYRIFNSAVPPPGTATGTTRKIWKLEANVTVSLPAGTYWVEWSANGGFAPGNTLSGSRTTAGANALQKTVSSGVWAPVIDAGNPAAAPDVPLDFPFQLNYTSSGGTCSPTVTLNPVNALTCVGGNTSFTVAATSTTSPLSYQWEFSTNGGGAYNNVPNAPPYTNTTSPTLNITGAPAGINTYMYRCKISSPTCLSANSNGATLTLSSLPAPTISPAAPVICLGGTALTQLNVTAPGAPGAPTTATFTQTYTAPGLTCVSACNLTSPITANIPVGAIVTGVRVTINMNHTWISDMVVNLRAPNNNILNLFNGHGGAGDNMINTVVSSAGVTLFSAGTPPYTGTFAPTATNGVGPAGNVSNVTTFPGLYSTPGGVWTLVLQDLFGGDEPFLLNWSIAIDYTPVVPQAVVWAPVTNLYTDAAGLNLYTGTPLATVYYKATAAGNFNYTATYTAAPCTSSPATIPIVVNTPVAITTQPANAAACTVQGTAVFTTAATGTGPLSYQWQVDNGTGFANVANGGGYAGAGTPTLTLTNIPTGWNGYKYRCVVTGAAPCGAVNTNGAATLTVNPLPTITLNASPYRNLFPGLVTTITATSVPAAQANGHTWTWSGGAVTTTGNTLSGIDVDRMGNYSVRVVDVNGCINTSGTISILDSVTSRIFVYPNPNNGQFQVRYHSARGNQLARTLNVFDSKGSKVYSALIPINMPYGKMDVNLGNLAAGVYTVELSDANGRRINTESVVVQ